MRALSIRQPYAELILRGVKTAELRSRPTTIVGERFYIYASRQWADFGELWDRGSEAGNQKSEVRSQRSDGSALTADLQPLTSTSTGVRPLTSDNLAAAAPGPPAWMVELAEQVRLIEPGAIATLPRGVIVGTAVIERVVPPKIADGDAGLYRWELTGVERAKRLRRPTGHPQPVWFRPF